MEIIYLIGLNGAGKSTVASKFKEIIEEKGKKVVIESLATPLKELAKTHLGYDESMKRNGHRFILDVFGEDIKAKLGQPVFTYALLDKMDVNDYCIKYDYIIVDDGRFPIEVETLDVFNNIYIVEVNCKKNKNAEQSDFERFSNLKDFLKAKGYTVFITDPREDLSPIVEEIMEGY